VKKRALLNSHIADSALSGVAPTVLPYDALPHVWAECEACRKLSAFISADKQASQDSDHARFSNAVERHTPTIPHRAQGLLRRDRTTIYGSVLMIVRMIVVARSIDGGVLVSSGGGGGGSALPGECNIPANTETVRVKLRATTAPILRSLFTCGAS